MASILFLLCVYTNLHLHLFVYLFIYLFKLKNNWKKFTALTKIKVPACSSFLARSSFSHCWAAASLSTSLLGFHCSAIPVCDSGYYGLSFLTNFSLQLSPFPVLKAVGIFQSPLLLQTETCRARISPYTPLISSSLILALLLFPSDDNQLVTENFILLSLTKGLLDFSPLVITLPSFKLQPPSTDL